MDILMVGKDKEILSKFQKILDQVGKVEIFNNFKQCSEKINQYYLENQSYDLVIIDLDIPESSGLQILKKIRTNEEKLGISPVKVVLLSSNINTTVLMNFFSLTQDIFFEKSTDEEKILEFLIENKIIDTRR